MKASRSCLRFAAGSCARPLPRAAVWIVASSSAPMTSLRCRYIDLLRPGEFDEPFLASPAQKRTAVPCCNVEAHAIRARRRSSAGRDFTLEEVEMAADLDRPVARVLHQDGRHVALPFATMGGPSATMISPGFMRSPSEQCRALRQRMGSCTVTSLVPSGKVA